MSEIWNVTISFASDAPLLLGDSVLRYEAIGGTLINIPLQLGSTAFQPNQIQPFTKELAPLAFAVMQWSAFLSANVAIVPIIMAGVRILPAFHVSVPCRLPVSALSSDSLRTSKYQYCTE